MIKIQDVCHDTLFHGNGEGEGKDAVGEKSSLYRASIYGFRIEHNIERQFFNILASPLIRVEISKKQNQALFSPLKREEGSFYQLF